MRRIETLYLSGPEIFAPDTDVLLAHKLALCEAAGFHALTPSVDAIQDRDGTEATAREIYAERASRLRKSDALIANLTPFRGPVCDPGAAFEAGFMAGLGKPVFAYMNVRSEDEAEMASRVEAYEGASPDAAGVLRDAADHEIEDYGLPETLMLWAEARRLYVVVTTEPERDLTGLQLCLETVKLYSD